MNGNWDSQTKALATSPGATNSHLSVLTELQYSLAFAKCILWLDCRVG